MPSVRQAWNEDWGEQTLPQTLECGKLLLMYHVKGRKPGDWASQEEYVGGCQLQAAVRAQGG
jgi:hypothetical protein